MYNGITPKEASTMPYDELKLMFNAIEKDKVYCDKLFGPAHHQFTSHPVCMANRNNDTWMFRVQLLQWKLWRDSQPTF